MAWKTSIALSAGFAVAFLGFTQMNIHKAHAEGCISNEKIDGSTADTAKQKIKHAGYLKVSGLKKGCDNFWHGKADKDGLPVNVVLSPKGDVMTEGD